MDVIGHPAKESMGTAPPLKCSQNMLKCLVADPAAMTHETMLRRPSSASSIIVDRDGSSKRPSTHLGMDRLVMEKSPDLGNLLSVLVVQDGRHQHLPKSPPPRRHCS